MVDVDRLAMPIGEAMFTQRSFRRLKTDPIPMEDIRLIVEAAVKAPNGGNSQPDPHLGAHGPGQDPRVRGALQGGLVGEAGDQGWKTFDDLPKDGSSYRNAAQFAEDIKDAPCIVFAFGAGLERRRAVGGAGHPEPDAGGAGAGHRLLPDDAPRRGHGALLRDVQHSGRRAVPLLHPAGLPEGQFRADHSQARPPRSTYLNGWGEPVPWS